MIIDIIVIATVIVIIDIVVIVTVTAMIDVAVMRIVVDGVIFVILVLAGKRIEI